MLHYEDENVLHYVVDEQIATHTQNCAYHEIREFMHISMKQLHMDIVDVWIKRAATTKEDNLFYAYVFVCFCSLRW